jgi:archaellum component FlaC
MSETLGQRMIRMRQELDAAFPNGFGLLDDVKAELADKDATITALRAEVEQLKTEAQIRAAQFNALADQWRGARDQEVGNEAECDTLREQLARVELLAAEWESTPPGRLHIDPAWTAGAITWAGRKLREALRHD